MQIKSANNQEFEVCYDNSGTDERVFKAWTDSGKGKIEINGTEFTSGTEFIPSAQAGFAGANNIYYEGKIGIGEDFAEPFDSEVYQFYVKGNIYCDGKIMATGDVIASYSDIRLKTKLSEIYDPIEKIMQIETFQYTTSPLAQSFGINDKTPQIGVSAQSVQKILPEIVHLAPFDTKTLHDGSIVSKSGSNFLTVSYERLVPLLIECIKQQKKDIDFLKNKLM